MKLVGCDGCARSSLVAPHLTEARTHLLCRLCRMVAPKTEAGYQEWSSSRGIKGPERFAEELKLVWPDVDPKPAMALYMAIERINYAMKRMCGRQVAWTEKGNARLLAYGARPGEEAVVERILVMAADGDCAAVIARKLNESGVKSRSGGAWHPGVVGRILRRKMTVGVEEEAKDDIVNA